MHKPLTTLAISLLAAVVMLPGYAPAQDTPSATPPSKPAQSTPKTPAAKKTTPGTAAKPATGATAALTTQKQKESYALGMSIGLGFKKQGLD